MTRWVPTKREEKYGVGERRADPAGPSPPLPRRRDAACAVAAAAGKRRLRPARPPAPSWPERARWPATAHSDSAHAVPASWGAGCATSRGAPPTCPSRAGTQRRRLPAALTRSTVLPAAEARSWAGPGHSGHCSPRLSALWLKLCSGCAAPEDGVKLQGSKRSLRGWEVACATRAARSRSRHWGALPWTARDPRRAPRWPRGQRALAAEGGARFGGGAAVIASWAE